MIGMRICAYVVCVILFASASFAQTINIRVNGIEVGSTQKQVLRKLGRATIRRGGTFPCDEQGQMRTMRYPGLELRLIESYLKPGEWFVAMIVV
ncbi:MAG TPA: hypothetical protein PKO33_00920, partial [Pyrinomonadaceae bacterium]|nr:hypothetical protein [Pyrinomonadaceae bacterium]